MERSMRVRGEGEVPFYGRGRVRHLEFQRPRGEGFGPWHQGFRDAGRSAATVEAGDFWTFWSW
jgi:hypothetical protein